MTATSSPHRSPWRGTVAVFVGLVAVVVLSLGTDQVLHVLEVYPPWGQPMNDAGQNLLALAYRCVYGIFGSYLAARLAPHSPMRHAMILGVIGLFLSVAGVVAATQADLGPIWYPISLVFTALPCAWLGGVVHRSCHVRHGSPSAE